MPLVTIIIPVYNTKKYVKKCLDSVVNQTYKNIEIILINDASTDYSLTILENYRREYRNIKLINNPINLGVSISRNIGLDSANGDYIYFLDSDDFIRKDAIEKLVNLATLYDVPLVEAKYTSVFTSHESKRNIKVENRYINLEKEKNTIKNYCGIACNKLFAHNLIKRNMRFPESLRFEDNAFIYPFLTIAKKSIVTNEILYFYRRHFNSFIVRSALFPNDTILDLYEIVKIMKDKCIELGTYGEYKEVIDAVILEKIFDITQLCSTWISIKSNDKKQIINNLYQYNRKQYQMPNINHMCDSNLRKKILRYYINENAHDTTYENSLEPAKRILSKYKR